MALIRNCTLTPISLGILIVTSACASVGRLSSEHACSEKPPEDARPATTERIDSLIGRFSLVTVNTSWPSEGIQSNRTDLELARADSATVAAARGRMLGRPRDLRLVGSERWSTTHPPQPAEVDAGTLYIGCRDCLDGSPNILSITAISAHGFWGTWTDYQGGLIHNVGRNGQKLPRPAGYFCAMRR
jgi:hypothetical protein